MTWWLPQERAGNACRCCPPVFRSAGAVYPMRSPRPWCFSPPTTAATSRERNCLWMAVSRRCRPRGSLRCEERREDDHKGRDSRVRRDIFEAVRGGGGEGGRDLWVSRPLLTYRWNHLRSVGDAMTKFDCGGYRHGQKYERHA